MTINLSKYLSNTSHVERSNNLCLNQRSPRSLHSHNKFASALPSSKALRGLVGGTIFLLCICSIKVHRIKLNTTRKPRVIRSSAGSRKCLANSLENHQYIISISYIYIGLAIKKKTIVGVLSTLKCVHFALLRQQDALDYSIAMSSWRTCFVRCNADPSKIAGNVHMFKPHSSFRDNRDHNIVADRDRLSRLCECSVCAFKLPGLPFWMCEVRLGSGGQKWQGT